MNFFEIDKLKVLSPVDGDVIVVTCHGHMSEAFAKQVKEKISEALQLDGKDVQIVLIDEDFEFDLIRGEKAVSLRAFLNDPASPSLKGGVTV